MNRDKAIINFISEKKKINVDIEVPLNISANDLVKALNTAYGLGKDISDIKQCYLKAEKPIALLRGGKTLEEYGIRNGTIIFD